MLIYADDDSFVYFNALMIPGRQLSKLLKIQKSEDKERNNAIGLTLTL